MLHTYWAECMPRQGSTVMVQVLLTMLLAGGVASAIGASIHEGVFVGALVCMTVQSLSAAI